MKKRILLSILTIITVIASPVYAAFENIDNAWQECGLGAMVFPDNRVAAAISNVIWDLGTTAVTSASASEDTCKGKKNSAAAKFVNSAYAKIEEDIAKGDGKHMSAALDLFKVSPQKKQIIKVELRQKLAKLHAVPSYEKLTTVTKAQTIYHLLESVTSNV